MWPSEKRHIKLLTHFYRLLPVVFLFLSMLIGHNSDRLALLLLAGGLLIHAAYSVIGYRLRWKHIYCAFQISCRKKIAPEDIQWNKMTFGDAYGVPIAFTGLAIVMLLVCFFVL